MNEDQVYVLHVMLPGVGISFDDMVSQIFPYESLRQLGLHIGYELQYDICRQQDFALKTSVPIVRNGCWLHELAWMRPVEQDEVFDAEHSLLVLRPQEIVTVTGSFAQQALEGQHGRTYLDIELELFDAAFERLLDQLGNDYSACRAEPWPDELPRAIERALKSLRLLTCSVEDVDALQEQVVRQVP